MEYVVLEYGDEWGIWAITCRAFVLFGDLDEMCARCAKLNREERP